MVTYVLPGSSHRAAPQLHIAPAAAGTAPILGMDAGAGAPDVDVSA